MAMRDRKLNVPTIALIAGTRAALGLGIGLILADRISPEARRAAGWVLFAVGALTTIPLVAQVFGDSPSEKTSRHSSSRDCIPTANDRLPQPAVR
jgi:hypothetical protein